MPTEQMLAPRNREYLGLRVSDKKDLTRVEILMVVSLLIYNDSIYYFLQNFLQNLHLFVEHIIYKQV